MKKLLTLSLGLVSALTVCANPIDQAKAKSIASEYLKPGHSMTLVANARRTPSKARRLSAVVAATSPYYVYSRGAGQGFVIVSGDDCLPEVLGYTDQGDFDESNLPPALQDMLDYYAQAVENAQENGTNNTYDYRETARKAAANRQNITPFVTSHWHQSSPYNDICPCRIDNGARAMTGCVATAASQILYYWRKDLPNTLQSTTPTYSYGNAHPSVSFPKGTPVKWDLMCDKYSGSEPAEYKQSVAEFVYCVGTATWLTYADGSGTATSGNIEKIPATFSEFFGMNGGWVAYRNNYSQESWTQLLYNELANGRPVMYTGVHPTNGGHAVFIHGYQASTDKFYFNFGWGEGNGYDGYYTTTETDGMNGFNTYQSALIGAYPKKWNIETSITAPKHVWQNVDNEFRVKITNNSTLDFNGIYIFASTTNSKPTDLKSAKSSDLETVIAKGETGYVTLTAKPALAKTLYVYVTDENLTVLAKEAVEVETPEAKLSSSTLMVDASSEYVESGAYKYNKVYNTKAAVSVSVKNDAEMAFGGTAKLDLYVSNDGGQTFEFVKAVSKSNVEVAAKSDVLVTFNVTSLATDKLYYAVCSDIWGTSSSPTAVDNSALSEDAVARFCVSGSADLAVDKFENGSVKMKGHWDASQFATLIARTTYKTAVEYDLTNVESMPEGISTEFEYPFVNALVYTPSYVKSKNMIDVQGRCAELSLAAGNDFMPRGDFKAAKFSLNINQVPNKWYLLTTPCDCTVPNGVIAREVSSHKTTSTGISNSTENVTVLEAGKTYLVMTSSKKIQTLTGGMAANVEAEDCKLNVLAKPSEGVKDAAFVGVYVATGTPKNAKIIKEKTEDTQYFMRCDEGVTIDGLRGYFFDEKMTSSTSDFRAYSSVTLDPAYLTLGKSIEQAIEVGDIYCYVVSEEANSMMADSLMAACQLFSNQELTSSTEVKKCASALLAFAEEYKMMVGIDSGNEVDMSAMIVNPSFEANKLKPTGWTVEGTASMRANSNLTYKTVYGDGDYYVEAAAASKVSQMLSGLKPGYYRLSAMVGSTSDDAEITLFAGNSTATVSAHPFGKHYLSEAVIDDVRVGESGELNIGVTSASSFNVDHFVLTFVRGADIEDGIVEVTAEEAGKGGKQGIYDMTGRKIEAVRVSGIYIIDGKKVLFKK